MVSESGWPSAGSADEIGATPQNAQAYNQGLIKHVRGGTPRMPGGLNYHCLAFNLPLTIKLNVNNPSSSL